MGGEEGARRPGRPPAGQEGMEGEAGEAPAPHNGALCELQPVGFDTAATYVC